MVCFPEQGTEKASRHLKRVEGTNSPLPLTPSTPGPTQGCSAPAATACTCAEIRARMRGEVSTGQTTRFPDTTPGDFAKL